MAIKVFNYTDDKYIEAADTRAELAAIVGNGGVGFKGNIERNGTTDTYTVKAGSHAFIGGLSVRFITDESFDLTTNRYIAIQTTYSAPDTYSCTVVATSTMDLSSVGSLPKQVIIYDKQNGRVNDVYGLSELKIAAQMRKITADDGNVSISFNTGEDILNNLLTLGRGMRTFYAPTGAVNLPPSGISVRGMSHFTNPDIGWVLAIDYRGNAYVNYHNGSAEGWIGWKEISSVEQTTLWSGAKFMHEAETQTIYPSKRLSQCRQGWVLAWSDYNPGEGSTDWEFHFSFIPKKIAQIHSGTTVALAIPSYIGVSSMNIAPKWLFIHDDKILGKAENDESANYGNDVCLRYVWEW